MSTQVVLSWGYSAEHTASQQHLSALPATQPLWHTQPSCRLWNTHLEEILIVAAQFLIEVIGQALLELPFEWGDWRRESPERGSWLRYLVFLCLGGLVGGLTLLVFPHTLLHHGWLRLANLVCSPLLSAGLAHAIAEQRSTRRSYINPAMHGWTAFWFTLGVALIRFSYATH